MILGVKNYSDHKNIEAKGFHKAVMVVAREGAIVSV